MNKKGSVSIFLLVIFPGILILLLILFDISRYNAARTFVKRAVNDSALALMSFYDSDLKTKYGIFGLEGTCSNNKEFFKEILDDNLNVSRKGLYDFKVEDVDLIFMDDLGNPKRVKEQILEYMKFRMPADVLLNIYEKLTLVKNTGEQAVFISEKIVLDTMMYELDKLKLKIINLAAGTITNFNKNGARDVLIHEFVALLQRSLEEEVPLEEIDSLFSELYFRETSDFLNANLEILSTVQNLIKSVESVKSKAGDIIVFLNATGFQNDFIKDIEEIIESLPDLNTLTKIVGDLSRNITTLENSLNIIIDIKDNFHRYTAVTAVNLLTGANAEYRSINHGLKMNTVSGSGKDIRKDALRLVKEFFAALFEPIDKSIDFNLLPSVIYEEESEDIDLEGEMDFDVENGGFIKKAVDYFRNLGKGVRKTVDEMIEDIYVSYYVLDRFEYITKNDILKYTDEKYQNVIVGEVEYILYGSHSEKVNLVKTLTSVLLIRFGINALEVYKDPVKKKDAYMIATAVSGIFLNGAGVVLCANLIMCAIAMIDSVKDLEELHAGKDVPVFKKSSFKLNYEDYLIILLIARNMEGKVLRLMDIIQINLAKENPGYMIGERACVVSGEVTVSMKMIFLPGRRNIKVEYIRKYQEK